MMHQSLLRCIAAWFGFYSFVNVACAHLPDTSYAKMIIEEKTIAVELTYDVTSLIRLHATLDENSDHQVSPDELQRAIETIDSQLRNNIAFEVNETRSSLGMLRPVAWPVNAGSVIAESDYHAATSLVTFRYEQERSVPITDVWIEFQFFKLLGNRHTILGVIEEGSKSTEVLYSAFEPDYFYDTDYVVESATKPATDIEPPNTASVAAQPHRDETRRANESAVDRFKQFFVLGVEHILIGYDHILFLLALIVVSRFRDVVVIVTAFTVAHSITLALATLKWVTVPATLVETLIAATIIYTALENFWVKASTKRWRLTFLFGLIHGFGFAGVLSELGLPTTGFVRSLIAFNLGVEAGQLFIVLVLAVPIALVSRLERAKLLQRSASAAIAVCGLGWFVDRAFGLSWMPF